MQPVIEDRVVSLVDAINALPGITTFSSCGGHENATETQEELGRFGVDFSVDIKKGGWFSLTQIAFSLSLIQAGDAYRHFDELEQMPEEFPDLVLGAYWNGLEYLDQGVLDFFLKGDCEPEDLARTLDAVRNGDFETSPTGNSSPTMDEARLRGYDDAMAGRDLAPLMSEAYIDELRDAYGDGYEEGERVRKETT